MSWKDGPDEVSIENATSSETSAVAESASYDSAHKHAISKEHAPRRRSTLDRSRPAAWRVVVSAGLEAA